MILELLAVGAAAGMAALLAKSRAEYLRLPVLPLSRTEAAQDVTVIIPARNEESNIAGAIRSFVSQAPVIVVDDASDDRTRERATAAGATVISAPPLAKRAAGKPNACAEGAKHATTSWILFVDADTRYDATFLGSLLAEAESQSLDMLSVFLRQDCQTFWERVVLPYAFALYFCGVSARRVNSCCTPDALANGQCLLFRREAYEAMGGHSAVLGSVIEDAMLASLAKQSGLHQRVMRAEHLGHVRMYDSLRAIWRGFQKNSVRFLIANPLTGVQVVIASILLTSQVPLAIALLLSGGWLLALILLAVPAIALRPWYGGMRRSLWSPLAIYTFQAIVWSALLAPVVGRPAIWKGRRV